MPEALQPTSDLSIVPVNKLQKRTSYVLTWDFWPKGGSSVTFVRFEPYRLHYPGSKGECAIVRDADGNDFVISPGSYLFKEAK